MEASKPTPVAPPVSQAHFLDYWRIIRIRKTVIIAVWLLVVLTTVAVTLVLKPSYRSVATISVEKDTKDVDPLMRQQVQQGFDPYFLATEFEKIQSKAVLYPVIRDNNLRNKWAARYNETQDLSEQETFNILLHSLDVRQSRNTSLIEIRVLDEDKVEAAKLANDIAESYKNFRKKGREGMSKEGIAVLQEQLAQQTGEVTNLQARVNDLRIDLGISESADPATPTYQASIAREQVSSIAQQLESARTEYVLYNTKLQELTKLDRASLRKAVLTVILGEQLLQERLNELAIVEQNLAKLQQDAGPENPEYKKLQALRQAVERQVEDRLDGILTGLASQVVASKAKVDAMEKELAAGRKTVAEEAAKARPYYAAKRDLETQERIRDALMLRARQESVDAAIPTSSSVEVIDVAEVGLAPVRPNLTLNVALGIVVGLVMGVGLAFFIEYLDTSVKTIDDVERSLGSAVIGVIPQNVGILLNEGPDSPHAEAYRVLRTNVLFARTAPDQNTLTVVSGGAGEGKSTTIFNLATVFAQNGQRVLMIDSDLRRPSLHKYLNVSNAIGLTNYLLKQNSLEEVVQTTKLPTLDFLPSGKLPSSSLGLLNSTRMQEFIKEVKSRYDFVFFDSPPIMGVSDASILASEVDMSILVVQYRKYPQAINVRAKQMVEKVGGNLLGVVLNNINISQDSYYYYYSGYYYDYYSRSDKDEADKDKSNGAAVKTVPVVAKVDELKGKY
ncbi:MAG: polysaccharide biosynthesis tyrosine autokinase [Verrucomicrobiota bacterium]|jgi:capsular exopolysaccharide synthesis family protein